MFQASLQKLNLSLKQNYEYPSQKEQILQSIKENIVKNPQLMLDVLVKYSQVDKISKSYMEELLKTELTLKPNEMLLMGQLIHLNVKSYLQQFQSEDVEALLLLMRKLYAYYKQSNSTQMGALFLQLTQPTEANETLAPYYESMLQVLCKLSSKYSDDLPLFCILYLAKQNFTSQNVILPMTLNLKRQPNLILSMHLLKHVISLQPKFPFHFEIYYKLLLQNLNEHSIHVLAHLDVHHWIELYINYDCNPLMQINLFEKLISFFNKCISNGSDYDHNTDISEPAYPMTSYIPFTPNQLRSFCLKQLVQIISKWVTWMEQPLPVEQVDTNVQNAIVQKQFKSTLEEGIKKFNLKPKAGIAFLCQHNCISHNTPSAIAKFLYSNGHALDKSSLGDYLGELDYQEHMRAFIDLYDFKSTSFLDALRLLLQKFRLPGEAQKIDRLMLKFAERYTFANPSVFANADTAYVLAYSVIMLNTDLHNPQVKNRMTVDDFVKNNRGIDDGKDINRELLQTIYTEIKDNEIKLDNKLKTIQVQGFQPGQKEHAQELLIEDINQIEKEFNKLTPNNYEWVHATHPDHVRDMFQMVWTSLLATFSHPLQYSHTTTILQEALNGFYFSTSIACKYHLTIERDAFITTLSKYTSLSSLQQLTPQHALTVICLLDISCKQGDYLQGNWQIILTCISELDRLGILPSTTTNNAIMSPKTPFNDPFIQEIVLKVDKLWQSTSALNSQNILEVITVMCAISSEELKKQNRLFSLVKLVEISYYNMNRIKVEWTQLWALLGNHFYVVGMHSDPQIAEFAIDNLRQLALKFLELEELSNFKFQREFLKPFLLIIQHTKVNKLQDFVIRCLLQIVQSKYSAIKSGWQMISLILSHTTEYTIGLEFLKSLSPHINLIQLNNSYPEYLQIYTNYCNSPLPKISLASIESLKDLLIISNSNTSTLGSPEDESKVESTVESPQKEVLPDHLVYKLEELKAFHQIILTSDLEVRTRATTYLFDHLINASYPPLMWTCIMNSVCLPLLNTTSTFDSTSMEEQVIWLSTTMIHILRLAVDLFTTQFDQLKVYLKEFNSVLSHSILHGTF